MKQKHIILFYRLLVGIICISTAQCSHPDAQLKRNNEIVIEATILPGFYGELQQVLKPVDIMNIRYSLLNVNTAESDIQVLPAEVVDRKVKWVIDAEEPLEIFPPLGNGILVYPGDTVIISYEDKNPVYSGSNKSALDLLNELAINDNITEKPRHNLSFTGITLQDFNEWNKYLNISLASQLSILNSYKSKVTDAEYMAYKIRIINHTEIRKLESFSILRRELSKGNLDSSRISLNRIWDSTQCSYSRNWLKSLSSYTGSIDDIDSYNKMEVLRKFNFDSESDSIKSDPMRIYVYYLNAKKNYSGELREKLMTYILDKRIISELRFNDPLIDIMLKDYYSQNGFPEYKERIKKLEDEKRPEFERKMHNKELKKIQEAKTTEQI